MATIKKPIKKTTPVSKDPGTKDPDIMMRHGGKAKPYSGGGKVKKMAEGGKVIKNFSKPVSAELMRNGGKVVKKAIKK